MVTFRGEDDHEPMITVEEAQRRVLDLVTPLGSEQVPLAGALGRVLAEDVTARLDAPEGDNSAMDGYALLADDTPGSLRVIEDIPAGSVPRLRIERGTASRIMTGALVPEGADAIAQVEITDGGAETVRVMQAVGRGTHVRRRGEDMRAGEVVIARGTPIGAAESGVLASVQHSTLVVARRPKVAILATGDEVLDVDAPRRAGAIVNSNSYALAALAREAGAEPRLRGIARDTREATVAAIEASLDCDFIVSSGGVSAGAYDFVKDALVELGAEISVWRVAMKPGKPVVVASLPKVGRLRSEVARLPGGQVAGLRSEVAGWPGGQVAEAEVGQLGNPATRQPLVPDTSGSPATSSAPATSGNLAFGLPGNPVSCMVAFILFVAPAIRKAMGQTHGLFAPTVRMRVDAPLRSAGDRRAYLRVRVVARDGELIATPMKAQGSHISTSMLGANGLAIVEPGVTRVEAGELVPVLLIGNAFNGM